MFPKMMGYAPLTHPTIWKPLLQIAGRRAEDKCSRWACKVRLRGKACPVSEERHRNLCARFQSRRELGRNNWGKQKMPPEKGGTFKPQLLIAREVS